MGEKGMILCGDEVYVLLKVYYRNWNVIIVAIEGSFIWVKHMIWLNRWQRGKK